MGVDVDVKKIIVDWFNFRTLAESTLIKIVYVLANIGLIIYTILTEINLLNDIRKVLDMYAGYGQSPDIWVLLTMFVMMAVTLFIFVFGLFVVRLVCEFAIAVFGINETLSRIDKKK